MHAGRVTTNHSVGSYPNGPLHSAQNVRKILGSKSYDSFLFLFDLIVSKKFDIAIGHYDNHCHFLKLHFSKFLQHCVQYTYLVYVPRWHFLWRGAKDTIYNYCLYNPIKRMIKTRVRLADELLIFLQYDAVCSPFWAISRIGCKVQGPPSKNMPNCLDTQTLPPALAPFYTHMYYYVPNMYIQFWQLINICFVFSIHQVSP